MIRKACIWRIVYQIRSFIDNNRHCEPVRTLAWQSPILRLFVPQENGFPRRFAPRNDVGRIRKEAVSMKKAYLVCYVISLALCLVGILCRDWLNVLDKVLVLSGVALFLLAFMKHCISKAPKCPNCNAVIYSGHIRTIARQKDGLVPCEKCGSLVCVDYTKRN